MGHQRWYEDAPSTCAIYPIPAQGLRQRQRNKANTPTTESEAEEDEEEYMPDETFADRLVALKDIVPPTYRKHLSNTLSTTSSWFQTTLNYGGKTLWVVSTSVLLLGVPWALAFAEEQQMAEMEREMKMQQSANEVSFATHDHQRRGPSANGKTNSSLLSNNRPSPLCKCFLLLLFCIAATLMY
jgi:import receptor subunit TOM22